MGNNVQVPGFTALILATLISLCLSSKATSDEIRVRCKDVYKYKVTESQVPFNLNILEQSLDCLSQAKPLTRLGAQWLLLKKTSWNLKPLMGPGETLSQGITFEIEYSHEVFDPHQGNSIRLDISRFFANQPEHTRTLFETLENKVFNKALLPADNGKYLARSAFGSAWNHYMALVAVASPLKYYSAWRFDAENSYDEQMRAVVKRYPGQFQVMLERDPIKSRDWDHLWDLYTDIDFCYTSCLENLEKKVAKAQLLLLTHRELAKRVHEKMNPWGGCHRLEGFGSYVQGQGLSNLRGYNMEGPHSLIGQQFYFAALDRKNLDDHFYQGMNGVVQYASEAASIDYGHSDFQIPHPRKQIMVSTLGGDWSLPRDIPSQISHEMVVYGHSSLGNQRGLEGVSFYIADYYLKRKKMEEEFKTEGMGKSKAFEKAKEEMANMLNRPFFTEIYFEPIFFGGKTLKDWVEFLYKKNPRTPYQIFSYFYNVPDHFPKVVEAVDSFVSIANQEPGDLESEPFYSRALTVKDPYSVVHTAHTTGGEIMSALRDLIGFHQTKGEIYINKTEGPCIGLKCMIKGITQSIPKIDRCYVLDSQDSYKRYDSNCAPIRMGLIVGDRFQFIRIKDGVCFTIGEAAQYGQEREWNRSSCANELFNLANLWGVNRNYVPGPGEDPSHTCEIRGPFGENGNYWAQMTGPCETIRTQLESNHPPNSKLDRSGRLVITRQPGQKGPICENAKIWNASGGGNRCYRDWHQDGNCDRHLIQECTIIKLKEN